MSAVYDQTLDVQPRIAGGAAAESAACDVLVVVPCLNEAAHLDALIQRLRGDPGARDALICVVDGGSVDGSQDIVRAWSKRDPQVLLLTNERRIQSAGVNRAVRLFGSGVSFIIRIDAHSNYPQDYCARLLAAQQETGADSVVVSMQARANTDHWFQRATAAAQNSRIGTGGSRHRGQVVRQWISHGHHALMTRRIFEAVGGYDETFTHNEDAELDARIIQHGGRIFLAGDIIIHYFPRSTARSLLGQYFNYGRGRARTMFRHRSAPRVRQALPLAVAPAIAAAAFAPVNALLAGPALLWLSACFAYGVASACRRRRPISVLCGGPAAIMHLAWSAGFWSKLMGFGSAPPYAGAVMMAATPAAKPQAQAT